MPAGLTGFLLVRGIHPSLPGWPCPVRALTGIPCPTCFLSRATAAALRGDLAESVRLHAFGPVLAAALVAWSVLAIRRRRLMPGRIPVRPIVWALLSLLAYWLLRLGLSFGLGLRGFPAFPAPPV